jgi:predicted nucleic acid-binding protein
VSSTSPLLLVDKSAYVRGAPAARLWTGELCLCAVTRLELLYSARSPDDFERLENGVAEFRDLRMDASTFEAARTAQRELSQSASHRIPIPDLLVAACAQQHGAGVLHVDRHYETIASVLAFEAVRFEPATR